MEEESGQNHLLTGAGEDSLRTEAFNPNVVTMSFVPPHIMSGHCPKVRHPSDFYAQD
jgi:hypothetical protein